MTNGFELRLNGETVRVADVDPHTTLLAFVRARGLTGTKEACAEGECGACAVACVAAAGSGAELQVWNSCLVLLPEVAGAEVYTVEGVRAAAALHPVQQAMVAHGGSQCGYCTPGFVMSLFAQYYRSPRPEPAAALAGNLCRCTGYRPILDAAASLPAPLPDDPVSARLRRAAPVVPAVEYEAAGTRWSRPRTLADALALRAQHPDATVLQGGTDLVVDVNQNGRRHGHVLALGAIEELTRVGETEDHVVIGAGATWLGIERHLQHTIPLLAAVIPLFASPLIRARATLGGNLMTASPVGDAAPALLALDATVELASAQARRSVPLAEFFVGRRRTVLRPDELLVAVRVPKARPTAARFYKVSKRELDDIASVSGAFAVWLDAQGRVRDARFAFGGVAALPQRAVAAERALVGRALDGEALHACQHELRTAFTPIDDVRASAAYRAAMVRSLLAKFWAEVAP